MKIINQSAKARYFDLTLLMFFFITSCTSNEPPLNQVNIQGMAFTPSILTVPAGTTVKWTTKDTVNPTLTSDTNAFDSGNIAPNKTFKLMFMTPRTYNYHCSIHPTMTAKVVVK